MTIQPTGLAAHVSTMNARERLASVNRARQMVDMAHEHVARTPEAKDTSVSRKEQALTLLMQLADLLQAWADTERERLQ